MKLRTQIQHEATSQALTWYSRVALYLRFFHLEFIRAYLAYVYPYASTAWLDFKDHHHTLSSRLYMQSLAVVISIPQPSALIPPSILSANFSIFLSRYLFRSFPSISVILHRYRAATPFSFTLFFANLCDLDFTLADLQTSRSSVHYIKGGFFSISFSKFSLLCSSLVVSASFCIPFACT